MEKLAYNSSIICYPEDTEASAGGQQTGSEPSLVDPECGISLSQTSSQILNYSWPQ